MKVIRILDIMEALFYILSRLPVLVFCITQHPPGFRLIYKLNTDRLIGVGIAILLIFL